MIFMLDFRKKNGYNRIREFSFKGATMFKKTLFCLTLGLFFSTSGQAQLAFWNYDDKNEESQIPVECDATFDESRGGVFMPTVDELAKRGEAFLLNPDPVERNKAGYCLIAAALKGHIPSQYRVSQLYAKGIVLPQDDLSAYRWAFLASLNGHEEAAKHALLLERFLTTQEIELATASVQALLPDITGRYKRELAAHQSRVDAKKAHLEEINDEIDGMLGIKQFTKPDKNKPTASPSQQPTTLAQVQAQKAVPTGAIFSDADRMKK